VLGDTVTITREKNKISVTSENAFSKRWVDLAYLCMFVSMCLSVSLVVCSHWIFSAQSPRPCLCTMDYLCPHPHYHWAARQSSPTRKLYMTNLLRFGMASCLSFGFSFHSSGTNNVVSPSHLIVCFIGEFWGNLLSGFDRGAKCLLLCHQKVSNFVKHGLQSDSSDE
jgi:hypothetical protein